MKKYSVTRMDFGTTSSVEVAADIMEVNHDTLSFFSAGKVVAAFAPGSWLYCVEVEQPK